MGFRMFPTRLLIPTRPPDVPCAAPADTPTFVVLETPSWSVQKVFTPDFSPAAHAGKGIECQGRRVLPIMLEWTG